MANPVPKNVLKYIEGLRRHETFCLVIHLDGFPYLEINTRKQADFMTDLAKWKKHTQPTLRRSDVRYFTLAPTGEIKELTFAHDEPR